jgi:hypothetical protein
MTIFVIRSLEKATLPWKGELDQIPKAAWKLATRRQRIIAPLAELDHVTESEVEQAGKALRLSMRIVGNLVPVFLRPNRAGANAAAEASTRVSRKSLRSRSRISTYGEKNRHWQACIEKFSRRVTRPTRRLPHTRQFSPTFETSIHGR